MATASRYSQVLELIFSRKYKRGASEIEFDRDEIIATAAELGFTVKNVGDLVYSFRYRARLPASIQKAAGDRMWIIRPAGTARYRLVLVPMRDFTPNQNIMPIKVPDATPGIVARYALSDEQALLAKLRYNRLIDTFTGITCYSLQSHLKTSVPELGQVETDELYVGVDKRGAQFVIPVQAKGGRDRLNMVQIEQDMALCANRFAELTCRPIGAQFMGTDVIAIFEFAMTDEGVMIATERHYRLVAPDDLTAQDLIAYRETAD